MNITFTDDVKILQNMRLSTGPEDKDMVKINEGNNLLTYMFENVKVTSIYSLADELLKSYDVIKKIENLGE
jgi:hypothetical protein